MEESTGKIGFDRSRMRILLCDKDPVTAQEVKDLLCRCSYQVSVVKTARQVVEVLNIAESKVDIVLSEVELPNDRGFKMLKHIVKTDSFKHIPIVMMSARDEMAIVVKCLRLGAADYLVKPLRINELLNLWTHMWRRRRMLGLTERHIVKGQLAGKNIIAEILVSDTSESNTISTDILSEDSNDAKFKAKESNLRSIPEKQDKASPELELSLMPLSKFSKVSKAVEAQNQTAERKPLSPPRRNKLKLGQSSAFLSYTKASNRASNTEKPETTTATTPCTERYDVQRSNPSEERADGAHLAASEGTHLTASEGTHLAASEGTHLTASEGTHLAASEGAHLAASEGAHLAASEGTLAASEGTLAASEGTLAAPEGTHFQQEPPPPWNTANQVAQINNAVYGRPHLMSPPLMLTHSVHPSVLMQPALHYYQPVQPDVSMNMAPAATFSYYPFPIHMTSQQVGPWRALPPPGSVPERKSGVAERREAALNKFRQKRKDRCYEKKIRYASRKRLAEQRPRIKGQFVRRTEDYEEEEEDDDELSPESGVEVTQ